MSKFLTEKTMVKILFILVVVIFSFAQEDSKKMSQVYSEAPALSSPTTLMGDFSAKQAAGTGVIRFRN
ncbi:MAG: hypothetical protein IPQ08_00470 [Chitinophagaceae bacterium]|nr:hypothetical protein [Chitinophagaceae bacterium]